MKNYTTVRELNGKFYVNTLTPDGKVSEFGKHPYSHKRSARTAAEKHAFRNDLDYHQNREYSEGDVIPALAEEAEVATA